MHKKKVCKLSLEVFNFSNQSEKRQINKNEWVANLHTQKNMVKILYKIK